MSSVQIKGVQRLLKKLDKLNTEAYKAAISESATHVKRKIATYPPSPNGRPQFKNGFKSRRQQGWFFKSLKDGSLQLPWRRGQSSKSQRLGTRWTIQFRDNGRAAVIGNNAGYAPYVQDKERQSLYHKRTGWPTIQGVASKESKAVKAIITKHYQKVIDSKG